MQLSKLIRQLLNDWLTSLISEVMLVEFLVSILMIAFWVVLAYLTLAVVRFVINRSKGFKKVKISESKEQITVIRLVNKIIKALFIFWIIVMVLSELGIDLMPVLAGAGVVAFGIGFGAQELVKDVISGLFLIIEKTFRIDDFVSINGYDGTITDIGIRRTKIENWLGQVITINNGDIKTVVNHSMRESVGVVVFMVDPKFNINHFTSQAYLDFCNQFTEKHEDIIEGPGAPAILDIYPDIKLRITFKTKTRKHVSIERAFRKELLAHLDENGLTTEIPVLIKDFN